MQNKSHWKLSKSLEKRVHGSISLNWVTRCW